MKRLLQSAFHGAGGMMPFRLLQRAGLRILVYHRFNQPASGVQAALSRQCDYIRSHYRPMTLSAVAEHLEEQRAFPPRALAVTVDDGYRDFFDAAYPVFQKFGIPVTVFLTTGFLDGECWLWIDQLRYLFEHAARRDPLQSPPFPRDCRLDAPEQRVRSAREVKQAMKSLPNAERLRLLASLPGVLGSSLPESVPESCAPLTWDQVRLMRRNGVEFGAHTVTHPILAAISDGAEVRSELSASKKRIEEELQEPVWHFAYPNGRLEDISDCARKTAAEGFRTAVTTQYGHVTPRDDRFLLKRMVVEPDLPEFWFEEILEMFRPEAKGIAC